MTEPTPPAAPARSVLCEACGGAGRQTHAYKSFGRDYEGKVRVRPTFATRRCTKCLGRGRCRVVDAPPTTPTESDPPGDAPLV